jgi:hypothetical protein
MAVNQSRPTPPRLHLFGVAGKRARPAGCQLSTPSSPHPHTSLGPPMWASVASGEACARMEKNTCPGSVVTAAEFAALYERCMVSGLKARLVISHAAGCQAITVSCSLPVPAETAAAAGRRCHHRRRRRGRTATAAREPRAHPSSPVIVAPAGGNASSLAIPPPPSSPEIQPPPAKKTR